MRVIRAAFFVKCSGCIASLLAFVEWVGGVKSSGGLYS